MEAYEYIDSRKWRVRTTLETRLVGSSGVYLSSLYGNGFTLTISNQLFSYCTQGREAEWCIVQATRFCNAEMPCERLEHSHGGHRRRFWDDRPSTKTNRWLQGHRGRVNAHCPLRTILFCHLSRTDTQMSYVHLLFSCWLVKYQKGRGNDFLFTICQEKHLTLHRNKQIMLNAFKCQLDKQIGDEATQ